MKVGGSGRGAFVLIALAVAATGCAPPRERVYVNLSAVLRADDVPQPENESVPRPPAPQGAAIVRQPGRASISVFDPSHLSEQEVREAIQSRQRLDYLRLVERLKAVYEADSLRFELEQEREQELKGLEAYRQMIAGVRELFEEYGHRRGPILADLTLLVGFPDRNPRSIEPKVEMGAVDRQRHEKAKAYREQLAVLEAEFDAEVNNRIAQIEILTQQEKAQILESVRNYRHANDERAEREAGEQVQESVQELGLRLAVPVRLTLPAVPDRETRLPAAPAPKPAPQVTSEGVLAGPADRRLLAERQLKIWTEQNRFELVRDPDDGKDRTNDFIVWRTDLLTGR